MTREEAIEYGMRWKNAICDRGDTENSEAVQFLNMAIEALEQEPTAEYSSDVISRQGAIDAFDGVKVDEKTEYDIGYNDGIDFAVSKLSVLPSADRPTAHWKDGKWCSNCGEGIPTDVWGGGVEKDEIKFCFSCGARIEG